ncbi:MAG: phosphoribosylamine--glycine ligase [Gammaproteobacteria bacterium WSBS_2016_MAG_OTU1]
MGAHVLIVGGGGREHALAWKLQQSPLVSQISMTAHNAATAKFTSLAPAEALQLVEFCRTQNVALVVIGPEVPLAAGLTDILRANKIAVFAPSQAAAQIESSKIYAKQLMRDNNIRTADFAVCDSMTQVEQWLKNTRPPFVIKADGLAAGKGVLICQTEDEAKKGAEEMLGGRFGDASQRLLLEENLEGKEISFIVLTDGTHALPLATCQDYKRLGDNNTGANTGGMGVISPAPAADDSISAKAMEEVIFPALRGMAAAGTPFCGFLYAGLMMDKDGVLWVLEFNARLGDPETQVILPRMESDLYPPLLAAANGDVSAETLAWSSQTAVGVVLAAAGYPQSPVVGDVISLPTVLEEQTMIFHAGTVLDNDEIKTAGGRVLAAVALGDDVSQARDKSYRLAKEVEFNGVQFRTDIAKE